MRGGNRRVILFQAGKFAGFLHALLLLVFFQSPSGAATVDIERLQRFPLIEAIRLDSVRQIVRPILSDTPPADVLRTIERQPVDVGTSLLLGALASETRFGGLSIYFLASMRGALASEIADAMKRARMQPWEAVFLRAVQAARKAYPAGVPPAFSVPEDADAMNELANRVYALNEQFTACGDFAQRTEAFVQSSPLDLAYFERIRQAASPEERLNWLDVELGFLLAAGADSEYHVAIDGLPEAYRYLAVTYTFEAEVLNGGVDQFFRNSSGDFAPLVAEAFRAMDLPDLADDLQKGIDLLGKPYPYDRGQRFERIDSSAGFESFDDRLTSVFDSLDQDGTYIEARIRYAKSQGILPE